jgi:hypothetical protein
MTPIAQIFSDPYDPDKSFWVHQGLGTLRTEFEHSDLCLKVKKYAAAKVYMTRIANNLPAKIRQNFFKRAVYLSMYLKPYTPFTLHRNVDHKLKMQFLPDMNHRDEMRFHNVRLPDVLKPVAAMSVRASKELYGQDILKTDISVRYASEWAEAPFTCDDPSNVDERLLSAMHIDQKKGITSIVYLSNVNERNGCFSYLEGSELIPQSPTIRAMHEAIQFDLGINTKEKAYAAGIPLNLFGTTQCWQNLPKHKRDLARAFLVKHLGPCGTSITFAGNMLVHSGGYPIAGERYALFIAHTGLLMQRAKPLLAYYKNFH